MTATTIEPASVNDEQVASLTEQGSHLIREGAGFRTIRDEDHRDLAVEFGKRIKKMRTMVGELFDDPIEQAHKLHKVLCTKRKSLDDPLVDAEKSVRSGVGEYERRKQAEIEAQRQRELAEARRQAEEAEIERQRQIAEAQRIAEENRLAQATALEAEGKLTLAEAVINTPVIVPEPPRVAPPIAVVTQQYQRPAETKVTTRWKFEITNAALLPREYLIPDEKSIGAIVTALKDKTSIPGVRAYPDTKANW